MATVAVSIRLLSGTTTETACPAEWSAAKLREHVIELFDAPDTDVVLRHAGGVVDDASGTVEALAGGAGRLELEAVLQWRFADAAAANQDDALIEAAALGHAESVERLLMWRADLAAAATQALSQRLADIAGARWLQGAAALHTAAATGNVGVFAALLSSGANLEARTEPGRTPLHLAAINGHQAAAERLLASRAAVDATANDGTTPLHIAAHDGHAEAAEVLLSHRAAVDAAANEGHTPLHVAAQNGHWQVAEHLLAHRAALDAAATNGGSPLHFAADRGHAEVAVLLIALRAAPSAAAAPRAAAAPGAAVPAGTPLHLAANRGHSEVAVALLACQAEVDNAGGHAAVTPLHIAAGRGHRGAVEALLAHRASVDAATAGGKTPLRFAKRGGHAAVAEVLAAHQAAMDRVARSGGTNFRTAAQAPAVPRPGAPAQPPAHVLGHVHVPARATVHTLVRAPLQPFAGPTPAATPFAPRPEASAAVPASPGGLVQTFVPSTRGSQLSTFGGRPATPGVQGAPLLALGFGGAPFPPSAPRGPASGARGASGQPPSTEAVSVQLFSGVVRPVPPWGAAQLVAPRVPFPGMRVPGALPSTGGVQPPAPGVTAPHGPPLGTSSAGSAGAQHFACGGQPILPGMAVQPLVPPGMLASAAQLLKPQRFTFTCGQAAPPDGPRPPVPAAPRPDAAGAFVNGPQR